jgi:hypothetical protein
MDATGWKPLDEAVRRELDALLEQADLSAEEAPPPLDDYINSLSESSFHDTLWDFIIRDGRRESAIYGAAGITRSKFSRIRSDRNYRPDKLTAVSLIFALGLSIDAAETLLRTAGLALSRSNRFDLIVRYFLERGETDPFTVNNALFAYKEPLICGVQE